MMDRSVPWIGLAMRCDDLTRLPEARLPGEYGARCYAPGDERHWARIETSAGEFPDEEAALKGLRKWFPTDDALDERMLFLTDRGVPFATANAWYDDEGGPTGELGRLHWVGIDAAHQRQGLCAPLIRLTLDRMRALGHRSAWLSTQTNSWVAIKVYRRFGFIPMVREDKELEGWRIVSEKTGIDFLRNR